MKNINKVKKKYIKKLNKIIIKVVGIKHFKESIFLNIGDIYQKNNIKIMLLIIGIILII